MKTCLTSTKQPSVLTKFSLNIAALIYGNYQSVTGLSPTGRFWQRMFMLYVHKILTFVLNNLLYIERLRRALLWLWRLKSLLNVLNQQSSKWKTQIRRQDKHCRETNNQVIIKLYQQLFHQQTSRKKGNVCDRWMQIVYAIEETE